MPPKKNVEEVQTEVETTTETENTTVAVNEVAPEVSGTVTVNESARAEAILAKAVALSGQIQYYNSGIHGVDGDMSYTLAVAPPAMIALRELLTLLRAEIKG